MINLPWSVKYNQRFPTWDEKSLPRIVDSTGKWVLVPDQFVGHPGDYDAIADAICLAVVSAVNKQEGATPT